MKVSVKQSIWSTLKVKNDDIICYLLTAKVYLHKEMPKKAKKTKHKKKTKTVTIGKENVHILRTIWGILMWLLGNICFMKLMPSGYNRWCHHFLPLTYFKQVDTPSLLWIKNISKIINLKTLAYGQLLSYWFFFRSIWKSIIFNIFPSTLAEIRLEIKLVICDDKDKNNNKN